MPVVAGRPAGGNLSGYLATDFELDAVIAETTLSPFPTASLVTQDLYERTQPTPDGGYSIRPLAVDPNVSGRIWAVGTQFAQIGWSDDHGETFTAETASPASGIQQLLFGASYAWLLNATGSAGIGQLWRSPLPDSNGNGLSWTSVFDLDNPPGGLTTGDNASLRNSCVAVSGANVYLLEYSTATITGGPSLFYSSDSGANWSKPKTWTNGKHGHAVQVIGGVPWVMIGDSTFTDLGLYNATTAAATTWNRRSLYGEANDGNTLYGINFHPMTVQGQSVIVSEYDGNHNGGPLVFCTQSISKTKALLPTCTLPAAYAGTMRGLTETSEGNLMWVQTGENAAVGPLDSIWIARPPFTAPVLLESFTSANTLGTIGDPVEDGDYVWFGTYRCRKELFPDQS